MILEALAFLTIVEFDTYIGKMYLKFFVHDVFDEQKRWISFKREKIEKLNWDVAKRFIQF